MMLHRLGFVLLLLAAFTAQAAPAGYPAALAAEVAPYPGAHVNQQGYEEGGAQASMSVKATADQAMGYYRDALEKKGWKQGNFQQMGAMQAAEFLKGKRRMVITVMEMQDHTDVTIGLGNQ